MARHSIHALALCAAMWTMFAPAYAVAQANRYDRFNRSASMFGPRRFGQPFQPPESRFSTGVERSASGAFLGINRPTGNAGSRGELRAARETRSSQWLLNPPPSALEGAEPMLTAPQMPVGNQVAEPSAVLQQNAPTDWLEPPEAAAGPQFPEGLTPNEALGPTAGGEATGIPVVPGEAILAGEAAMGAGQVDGFSWGVPSAFADGLSTNNLPPITRWTSSLKSRRQSLHATTRILGNEQLAERLAARINRALGESVDQPIRVRIEDGKAIAEGAVAGEDRRAVITNLLLFEPGISEVDNRVTVEPSEPSTQ